MSATQESASLHNLSKVDSSIRKQTDRQQEKPRQLKRMYLTAHESDSQGCVVRSDRTGCLVVIALNL